MTAADHRVVLHEGEIERALTRLAHEIVERNPDAPVPALVGIHRRGAFLAGRIHVLLEDLLQTDVALGDLDIGFYRDDVGTRPEAPVVHASHIDFDVSGLTVVIVDDVLYTGPIRPDYVGKNLPTSTAEHVHVRVNELDGVDEVAIAVPATAEAGA